MKLDEKIENLKFVLKIIEELGDEFKNNIYNIKYRIKNLYYYLKEIIEILEKRKIVRSSSGNAKMIDMKTNKTIPKKPLSEKEKREDKRLRTYWKQKDLFGNEVW